MKHALLIDDNPTNLEILEHLLRLEDIDCTTVSDPRMIATVISSLTVLDLIFLDLEMPGQDGYQVLEWLSQQGIHRNVPIVAHTVHLSQLNQARSRGFHSFIGKPLNMDKFPGQLASILNNKPVWITG